MQRNASAAADSTMIISPRERGFILITVYFLMMVLSATALAIFTQSTNFLESADRNRKRIVAFNIAEAGFDKVFLDLKNGVITSFPHSTGYVSMNSGSVRGGYNVTVSDMGSGVRKIAATGYSPAQSSSLESVENRAITGYVTSTSNPLFNFGAFGKTSVTFAGNATIDSYNASLGAYGGTNVGSAGNIGTDAVTTASVVLTGNATIKGNITTGPGSNPTSVISNTGNAVIAGTISAATAATNPQVVTTSVASSGALNIAGNTTYTLAAGTYNFDSISISGNAQLQATGAVKIYVSGTVSISGNGISTANNLPSNTIIYSSSNSSVSISGNGTFYGGIYAPNSTVTNSGNGAIYGSIIAGTYLQTGNGNIHYDTSLQVVGATSGMSMLAWKET